MADSGLDTDLDPLETQEWEEALRAVIEREGQERAHFLLENLIDQARRSGTHIPFRPTTAYLNTIPTAHEARSPGDPAIEWRIRSLVRWNALAMVMRANQTSSELGGHIASFASAATLYDVGFNHFWRGPQAEHGADLVFFQGHSAPGIYARAFLEGRLTKEQLQGFRQEVKGQGLSSYPHPWLMPDFWQFPTVSMGLGPIQAIYQARFMRYLQNREFISHSNRKVWAFVGDGEMDEPESTGALGLAGRERLDNLVFVVNCNLQRLDGPVRGNGKIIQELEGTFRGAGWNVIKLIWGSYWDKLLLRDTHGLLKQRMEEALDGEYQAFKSKDGAFVREQFFGKYPELAAMVANMTDEDIWRLNRGGHDPHKVYAAYAQATAHQGQPTVILAKTVKGYGMGESGEGQNITHSQKKMADESLLEFRDRFRIPLDDEAVLACEFYHPGDDSPEIRYLKERRDALGGSLPIRIDAAPTHTTPDLSLFQSQLEGSGDREISTTMAFVRLLTALTRDKLLGPHVVPIVPDESRTFGMEGMFRQLGIYAPKGQLYIPEDADQLMYYREDIKGQVLQEGITEAGAMSSWIAAATAYSNHGIAMIPFYIFYSMFGLQRIGDLAWAAGDQQARGFLIGGTAGRTTLAGEGLQHQDGHSLLMAASIPNCVSYDPTFNYELAVIIHDGIRRMYTDQENVFYYVTVMNENYAHPPMPEGAQEGILQGMHRLRQAPKGRKAVPRVQLFGSGTILRESMAAAELLEQDFGVLADLWSVTSYNELARQGREAVRWNRLHPEAAARPVYVSEQLADAQGPIIAASDYNQAYADQIREFVNGRRYVVLGTDGYGRSGTREQLRRFFEVDRYQIAIAALSALADENALPRSTVSDAISRYGLNPDKPDPAFQ
ncbi:MAG: pyruvate dehydrogenase (acetyl-transferring), homodimeric type [Proteobacteria bacterium TMED51]|jgi:pyruvate dehydrogenase E1 component|nr:MAG: pyruvate dehydrogenase (acetyl-transferring), homodimeric type [Proteobacteria bacterium TMED51]|tara:strand:+ start:4390 stop:7065 length:2676 start_codon:yes stop_codon:yes gene_type:complete